MVDTELRCVDSQLTLILNRSRTWAGYSYDAGSGLLQVRVLLLGVDNVQDSSNSSKMNGTAIFTLVLVVDMLATCSDSKAVHAQRPRSSDVAFCPYRWGSDSVTSHSTKWII